MITQKFIENFKGVNNSSYVVVCENGTRFVMDANDNNVEKRAEIFSAYRKSTVKSITKI